MSNAYKTISAGSLYEQMRDGAKPLLVDVRSTAEYADGHVDGAVSIPLDELDGARAQARLGSDAGNRTPLFLICASGLRAEQAAQTLSGQGLTNLALVEGGTDGWAQRRLPMQRRGGVMPLQRQTQIALGMLILVLLTKGVLLHPVFYVVTGLLGIGLIVSGITARCGLTTLLARMPWNRSILGGQHPTT